MKNRYTNIQGQYDHYVAEREAPLLEYLLETIKGQSRTKIKATLQGRGIKVNGKCVTQFDYPLKPVWFILTFSVSFPSGRTT